MKPKVLGISASPQQGGKVDTLVQEVLSASRLPHELVRLHALEIRPCKACNACRTDNVCTIGDDWKGLSDKILDASALVVGGWAFSGMIDASTKMLMERFWSLRHHRQLTRGKVGAVVVVGANPELADTLADVLDHVAAAYDMEVEIASRRFLAVLEPALILIMAGIVGFIAMSLMVTILEISRF